MKIAVITDDGNTISQHFGRALFYQVLTIEEGKVISREQRAKPGHGHFAAAHTHDEAHHSGDHHDEDHHAEGHHGAAHGHDGASHQKHVSMAEVISDCEAVLCGGMGMGAYQSMLSLKIQPIVTDLHDINQAVQAYIEGKLIDHTERLH